MAAITELAPIKEANETLVGEKAVEVVKEPVEAIEPVKVVEAVEAIEPVKVVEPVEAIEPVKVVESVEAVKEPAAVPAEEANQSSTCACFGF